MINFDTLPQENPFALPPADTYKAKITSTELRKNSSGNPYLSIKLALTGKDGKGYGSVFDSVSESDSSVIQYKIGRLLTACGIPLKGAMELADIGRLILNKEVVVDIVIAKGAPKDKNNPDGERWADKAQPDAFGGCYYPIEEFERIWDLAHMNDNFVPSQTTGNEDFMNVPEGSEEVPFENSASEAEY